MKHPVILHGKEMTIELSNKAARALEKRDKPVTAVVHLIFGCMVAKRVWFKDQVDVETTPVTDNLNVAFNVVRYADCSLVNIDGGGEPEIFPLAKDVGLYVPDHVMINYSKSNFSGVFTYNRASAVADEVASENENGTDLAYKAASSV